MKTIDVLASDFIITNKGELISLNPESDAIERQELLEAWFELEKYEIIEKRKEAYRRFLPIMLLAIAYGLLIGVIISKIVAAVVLVWRW